MKRYGSALSAIAFCLALSSCVFPLAGPTTSVGDDQAPVIIVTPKPGAELSGSTIKISATAKSEIYRMVVTFRDLPFGSASWGAKEETYIYSTKNDFDYRFYYSDSPLNSGTEFEIVVTCYGYSSTPIGEAFVRVKSKGLGYYY